MEGTEDAHKVCGASGKHSGNARSRAMAAGRTEAMLPSCGRTRHRACGTPIRTNPNGPIRSPKSVPDTVFPSRRAECHETYPALAYLTDKVRVIECRDRLQWILQCRRSVCPNSWRGVSFCRTREALLRCASRGPVAWGA